MAAPAKQQQRQNLPNIDITSDAEGNQYLRATLRTEAPSVVIGRLGTDIDFKSEVGQNKTDRAVFTMATDWRNWGEDERTTAWVRVTAWGPAAQILHDNLNKGDQVSITSEMVTTLVSIDPKGRVQQTESGMPKVMYEMTVDNFRLLGSRRNSNSRNTSLNIEDDGDYAPPPQELDDIPF